MDNASDKPGSPSNPEQGSIHPNFIAVKVSETFSGTIVQEAERVGIALVALYGLLPPDSVDSALGHISSLMPFMPVQVKIEVTIPTLLS